MAMMQWILVGEGAVRLVTVAEAQTRIALDDGSWTRGALRLESPALPTTLATARRQPDGDDRNVPTEVRARLSLCADDSTTPLMADHGDAVAYAAMLGEYIAVVADLINRTGMAALSIEPVPSTAELRMVINPVVRTRGELREALWLAFIAAKLCAHARGFVVSTMTTNLDGSDGRYASAIKA